MFVLDVLTPRPIDARAGLTAAYQHQNACLCGQADICWHTITCCACGDWMLQLCISAAQRRHHVLHLITLSKLQHRHILC